MIAALYVRTGGAYFDLNGVDPWDEVRDARKYDSSLPIVAHPPCQLWVNLTYVNYKRWGGEHNRPGNDGGCFASALANVRRCGGVLEHPADSKAWKAYGLLTPIGMGWRGIGNEYTCEVWQSAYGHKARKRTWLFYKGPKPFELRWDRNPGTHWVGNSDSTPGNKKPTLGKNEAISTPLEFRDELIKLAKHSAIPKT